MKTYSLFLSTLQPSDVINNTNLNNVVFAVNWDEIFNEKTGFCNVRCQMVTKNGTFTDINNGSLRASINSKFSQNTYGVCIAPILIRSQSTTVTVLASDTIYSYGLTIEIPKGNGQLTVNFLDRTESFMTGVLDYQLFLYFDVDDD